MKLRIDKLSVKGYQGKHGPYNIKWIQSNGEWYSAFEAAWNKNWREGDVIEAFEITEQRKGDKVYKNIKAPSMDYCFRKLVDLERRVANLERGDQANTLPLGETNELPPVDSYEDTPY